MCCCNCCCRNSEAEAGDGRTVTSPAGDNRPLEAEPPPEAELPPEAEPPPEAELPPEAVGDEVDDDVGGTVVAQFDPTGL